MKRRAATLVALLLGVPLVAAGILQAITLPNGWRIVPPPPTTAAVGTLPTGIVLSHDGSHAFVLETGHRAPVLRVLDARTLAPRRTIVLGDAFGEPLSDVAGDGVWVANTSTLSDQIAHVDTLTGRIDRAVSLPVPFFADALARSPDGMLLAVAGDLADRVALIRLSDGSIARTFDVGRHPGALAFAPDGRTLFVAERAERFVDAYDVRDGRLEERIRVGLHPAALLRNGAYLYVADSDDDDIAVIEMPSRRVLTRALLPFARRGIVGASPNALALDRNRLYVTCGAANAVAVFRVTGSTLTPLGAIPTGWYPTALAVEPSDRMLLIADGKGESGHANPEFDPAQCSFVSACPGYDADEQTGAIRRIPIPSDAELRRGLGLVESLGAPYAGRTPPPSPVVRRDGPIKHIIYVIKENRTYDQVLGDETAGDGVPALVMYGHDVTPNEHALVERFGLFDRFFCDAHVTADGHNWSMAAFANDYVEKMWPPNYARRRAVYDFEDGGEASVPHAGYLWDDAVAHGLSLRNYGEFVTDPADDEGDKADRAPVSTMQRALIPRTDPHFFGFDMRVPDVDRFAEWKREFDAFERAHILPQLEIVRLPRDHTGATTPGLNTPAAMVADNDRAVGLLVDAVSHSADWASTAIFILEDDAQNGPDHVDEQRSTLYVVSPYARNGVQHEQYTTSSVLRTIELILGLPPMTPYDAGARPLSAAFAATPDLRPFSALEEHVDLEARNVKTAYRATDSARYDFVRADSAPEADVNDILWHTARGNAPEPLFGAFATRLARR